MYFEQTALQRYIAEGLLTDFRPSALWILRRCGMTLTKDLYDGVPVFSLSYLFLSLPAAMRPYDKEQSHA